MMKTNRVVAAVAAGSMLLVGGCATRANSVAPVAVSSTDYAGVDCARLREQLVQARASEEALRKKQNNAAVADAAGVFLFLIPVGSIFGADVQGQLAQAKGETLAIERAISTRC